MDGDARITPSVNFFYQTKSYLRAFNLAADRIPAFTKTDLELRFTTGGDGLSVAGFVQNIEGHVVRTATFPLAGIYLSYYAPPRLYGLRATLTF